MGEKPNDFSLHRVLADYGWPMNHENTINTLDAIVRKTQADSSLSELAEIKEKVLRFRIARCNR